MKIRRKHFPETMETYLKTYGRIPFGRMPLNEVDSLLLCQLAYLKYDGLVPGIREDKASTSLMDLAKHPRREKLFADILFQEENRAMFDAMVSSRRFCRLKLNCYINLVEKEREMQFSAIAFLPESGPAFVAFRGTDETFVGWKEDFNMAFLSPVPGQELSAKYLNMVAGRFSGPFYVGGHSKGGNLAVYSAMHCASCVRRRILKIYNMDGPGFRPEILKSGKYEAISDRVVKLLPHSSVVGMLFESDKNYRVVESRSFGLAQHNPFHWKIRNGHFVMAEEIRERVQQTDNTLNAWILSLDEEQIRLFVDTLYQVLSASQSDNLIAATCDWKNSMNRVIAALKEVDEDTVKALRKMAASLFDLARVRSRENRGRRRIHRLRKRTKAVPPTG